MTDYENIDFEVRGGIAWLTFNRPDSLNAFSRAMGVEIRDAIERAAADDTIRVLVFTGAGRAFSAGADVKDERPRTPEGELDLSAGLVHVYNPSILALRRMGKPVIAAVNGPAAGFSCSLACACDFILAAESTYFLLAFVRIGLVPDGGASVTIPARIGLARANALAMLGDRLAAADALHMGLVNEVHPDEELRGAVETLAERLAAGPTGAYAEIKALVNRGPLAGLEDQLGAEAAAQSRRGVSPEYLEGVAAFREKRAADFAAARAPAAR